MYKTHRQNHDFQIAYFLAGACHTPDGAYASLCDQREDRIMALNVNKAGKIRTQAKRLRAEARLKSEDPAEVLEAQADLFEIDSGLELETALVKAAEDELAFIEKCMAKLEPLRKYSHLTLPEAHEAAQHDEWKLELIHRAENYMLTAGTIPADHFATMRMHPAFKAEIYPAIQNIRATMQAQGGPDQLLDRIANYRLDIQNVLLLGNQSTE